VSAGLCIAAIAILVATIYFVGIQTIVNLIVLVAAATFLFRYLFLS
jgi:hypothetical protein